MRSRLLAVFIFCSLGVAFAEDKPSPNEKPSETIVAQGHPQNTVTANQKADDPYPVQARLRNQPSMFNSETTCYTMRTSVAHTNLDKKFVLDAGPEAVSFMPSAPGSADGPSAPNEPYTTCTPSVRFDIRTANQKVQDGNTRK